MNAITAMNSPTPVKLAIGDYELLAHSGALDRHGKTELIEGVIVAVAAQLRRHVYAKSELAWRLRTALETQQSAWFVAIEGTVELSQYDLPEPDIAVIDEPRGNGYIPARSVKLVIEVADSSLSYDVQTKAALYARFVIPEYWIVDLKNETMLQYWQPENARYANKRQGPIGTRISSITYPSLSVETAGLI